MSSPTDRREAVVARAREAAAIPPGPARRAFLEMLPHRTLRAIEVMNYAHDLGELDFSIIEDSPEITARILSAKDLELEAGIALYLAAGGVWLFRVTGPSFGGDWWGTTDGDSKADALARVRRRMRQRLFSEYGEGEHTEPGRILVELWKHDFFTVAEGYL